ncbi:ubiquitin-like modifier-activating enzyme 7 isoform X3 [Mastomys coucha]|uniref:ubiquitin-like modifier-activating enzyme 7 isoform X3 n=1 Tax=Mastomys coucha TaxID=35658 RepID=UPI001261508C|nr:ubiquitin-like modifier-activating enzyme 7 isoform X3 [Mastomys coucha]
MDEELYSRQLYVLGLPAMERIQEAKVLLCGLQGLGAEVAKNLVLTGVGSLTLHDPHPTCWADLAAQFFLSEESLGRSRAEASHAQLAQLNEAVQISVHKGDLTEDLLRGFQVVVLTDSKLEDQLKVGTLCHKHGVCFLMAETRGLVGRLFCDFGEDFTVVDPTEAEPMTAAIQHISQGSPGIVTLRGGPFYDGDMVIFSDIEGMVELNSHSPQPVRVQKDGSLEIGDTTTFSRYLRGGVVTEVKRPKTVRHKPLDIALLQPQVVAQNTQEVQRAHCLHQAFHALHKFQQLHGRLPKPWDPDDAEIVVGLAQDLEPLRGTEEESLDGALLRTIVLSSAGSLSPMAAILGGVAAQEALKAISRKFMPLDQWLYFDALECLPDEKLLPSPEDCHPRNCRYDGQIAVFGTGLQEKLSCQHYLLRPKAEVAAAAARRLNPDLQVTAHTYPLDPTTEGIYDDSFFSRVHGVVAALDSFQARHYVAARCTHYLKPLLEAGTQGTRGSASVFVPEVTEVYRGPASDSEDAPYPVCTLRHFPSTMEHSLQWAQKEFEELFRLSAETINGYQQQTCTSPLGTDWTGTLALLQQVMGVLRTRPQTWRDCVVWALGHWQLCFHDSILELLRHSSSDKVLEDGTLFSSGSKKWPHPLHFDPNQDMHFLYILTAANLYARMHGLPGSQSRPALRELLKGLLESDPTPQNLFSAELGQEQLKELQETLDDWRKGPPLKPVLFVKVGSQDGVKNWVSGEVRKQGSLRTWVSSRRGCRSSSLPLHLGRTVWQRREMVATQPQNCTEACQWPTGGHAERCHCSVDTPVIWAWQDDDSNFHVDFVVAATDLRCQNYGILPVNHARIKQIVGRIIPAIVTSTAVVAGLLGLELYKVVSGHRSRGTFRHSCLHLAENHFMRSAPSAPAVQSFRHLEWTSWDRLKVPAEQPERTLESLLAHLQEEHGLKVEMLLHGQALLYSSGWSFEKRAQHLCLRVTELVQQVTGWKPKPGLKVLVFELSCEGEEDETAFPPLHYEL